MRTKNMMGLLVIMAALALALLAQDLYAGSKDLVATKRDIFQDDTAVSMRDMYVKREQEDKAFRETLMANSEESVKLLREIKVLLQRLNEKE